MPFQNRMMTLIAFLQAQNCSNLPGSWRHPSTMQDFLTPEYYQRIARTLEEGKFQMAFLMTAWRFPISIQVIMPRLSQRACAR
jgi:alkanesulfonate monooxygenase SsuD/methylene tetrahydromethanopterin reductase-like flavin-dependent oxidoreductase (luciferase family)